MQLVETIVTFSLNNGGQFKSTVSLVSYGNYKVYFFPIIICRAMWWLEWQIKTCEHNVKNDAFIFISWNRDKVPLICMKHGC